MRALSHKGQRTDIDGDASGLPGLSSAVVLPAREDHVAARLGGRAQPPKALRASSSQRSRVARLERTVLAAAGPGAAIVYLSLLVLIPLAAIAVTALSGGWDSFLSEVRNPLAWAALKFSFENSLIVVVVNTIAGTVIAWVLVRDRFPGRAVLSAIVDLPFALPTVVAGLTLLSIYGPDSPFHLNLEQARLGVLVALAFVTLPFSVRTVQPVLEELELDAEEAAASLGATPRRVLRSIVLPSLAPAMLSGAALSFARALGEYGSLVFLANLPGRSESASVYIYGVFENYDNHAAAAVALALLMCSLAVLVALGALRRLFLRDGAAT